MSTPQKIINLLNREELTVSEIAAKLGISRNSAHLQIGKLEATGAVKKSHRDHPVGAGKPAFYYRTASGHEDAFSAAYKPVLSGLIRTLSADLPKNARVTLLEDTGRSLARANGLKPTDNFRSDLQKSVNAVNALGAMAEIARQKQQPYVRCYSCPVATLVHADPAVCQLVAAFFAEATGKRVSTHCRRQETVVCGFSFDCSPC